MASDDTTQNTLDRLLTGLRGPLEAALRATGDKAADEMRRQAQEQLAQLRAAAKKQNDDLRTSAETQIAELKRMLEEIRRTAQQQIDTARRTLETEVAGVRARATAELDEAQRTGKAQLEDVQRTMEERLRAVRREWDESRMQLEAARQEGEAARKVAEAAKRDADAARQDVEAAQRDVEAARKDAETARKDTEAVRLSAARVPERDAIANDLRSLDEAGSLSDVLERLTESAARHAERAALLIVKGERMRGWQVVGFSGRLPGDSIDISQEEAGIAADAARQGRAVFRVAGERTRVPAFADAPDSRDAAALPVMVGGTVVAVLYADAASRPVSARTWPDDLDVLAKYASRVLETITVQQATGTRPVRMS